MLSTNIKASNGNTAAKIEATVRPPARNYSSTSAPLVDNFGRHINYLRLSVTDRCNFRCTYCMPEKMTFLSHNEVLSFEEIERITRIFVKLGVSKLRITGGEPLIRHNIETLLGKLSAIEGINELAVTTNGSQLTNKAKAIRNAGVNSINISIDSINPKKFNAITRVGNIEKVLSGINAAITVGFERIRLNAVILRGKNDDEVLPLTRFAIDHKVNIVFIEEMPLGQVNTAGKPLEFVSCDEIFKQLTARYHLVKETSSKQAGPARYWRIADTDTHVGLITPHSNNFCSSCNRLRITAEGRLLLCLGNEHSINLRDHLRTGSTDDELTNRILSALTLKPERHIFDRPNEPQILRFMNASGG